MRTSRRKPPLHKKIRYGTKKSIRRYQVGGGAEEDYQLGLAKCKERNFIEAVILFQKAVDKGHPSAALWLQYAMKKIAESVKVKNIRNLDSSNNFYLTYLINQGNSIRATHELFYNNIIEKAKPYVYPSRFQRAQNMLGSLAFWRGGSIEQELYNPVLPFDAEKVKQMAEFVVDAGQHSLVSSNEDMVLLISNIAKWIQRGTTDTDLAKHIVTASKNLTEIHLLTEIQNKRQEGQDSKTARINAESELTAYFMQMESNLVKALQKWDEMGYSELVKNIMGKAAAGGKIVEKVIKGIKTKRFVGGDVRSEVLASIPNTSQCNTGMIDSKKSNCYLCGFALDNYTPNGLRRKKPEKGKIKADCTGEDKSLCPPNAIDCEHVLGIQLALSHLNLVHTGEREYQKTTSNIYKNVINTEYDWSHKCCNMMKLDRSFIRKIVEGPTTGFYEPDRETIANVLASIEEQAKLNIHGEGYAYGCGCIAATSGFSLIEYLVQKQLDNVVARVKQVTDMINLQIAGIRQHLQNQDELAGLQGNEVEQYRRASEVYDSFIKFRFLSRITKNNWIKALTNHFIHGSIDPGSTEEMEANVEMEGGAKFGVNGDNNEEIHRFIKLADDQSSYDIGSIQLMSNATVVNDIRNIIKDSCDMNEDDKKQKLKEMKGYIKDNISYADIMIKTNITELTSNSTEMDLSEFLEGNVPNDLDHPIPIIKDQKTKDYVEYCRTGIAEQMQAMYDAKMKAERLSCPKKLYSQYRNYKLKMFSGALGEYYNPHIHMREEEAEDICRRMYDGNPDALNEWLEKQWEEERKKMNAPDMREKLERASEVIAGHETLKKDAKRLGIQPELESDLKGAIAQKRQEIYNRVAPIGLKQQEERVAAYEALKREKEKERQNRIQQQEQTKYHSPFNKMAGLDLPTVGLTVNPQQLPAQKPYQNSKSSPSDSSHSQQVNKQLPPSYSQELLLPPVPQVTKNQPRLELPLPPVKPPPLPPQNVSFQAPPNEAPIGPVKPLTKPSNLPSQRPPQPSTNRVIKYTDAFDPMSNAYGLRLRTPVSSSVTSSSYTAPQNPVSTNDVLSELPPPGSVPPYLISRQYSAPVPPFVPKGKQIAHMPQSAVAARTTARAEHAPILRQQRQSTSANIRSGRINAPAGSTRSQIRARETQPVAQPVAQPNYNVKIVNAPPNNMNNTGPLWNLGGRQLHRRKTNKKRTKSQRRSSKK
jgi:hypothetical protein